jgi:hypothetical protein
MPITGRSGGYLFTWKTKVELGIDPEDGSLEETKLSWTIVFLAAKCSSTCCFLRVSR